MTKAVKNFVGLFLFSQLAYGQTSSSPFDSLDQAHLKQQGQFLTLQIKLGEPMRIFVLGREEAKMDLNELELTVRRLNPYPGKVLSVTREGDFFSVPESSELSNGGDLEIKTRVKNKNEETFLFKLDKKSANKKAPLSTNH